MDTDRNLLFGVLALQSDLIDAKRFADACAAWAARKRQPLSEILLQFGWITPSDRADVERLVERKIKRHGGNVAATLVAVTDAAVVEAVRGVDDLDIHRSLGTPTTCPRRSSAVSETLASPGAERTRYTLTRVHGEGGLGRVWIAHDSDLNRKVALKELKPAQSCDSDAVLRFTREAQIAGQLEHPNIVPVYELARRPQDDQPFYTMRFVHGETLREAIAAYHKHRAAGRARPLELAKLLQVFISVCNAIAFAHSRGVIHRDLKPENVMLGSFGEVVLLDWGLAKLIEDDRNETAAKGRPDEIVNLTEVAAADVTVAGQTLGTPAYMSPEQADGRTDLVDARTDVYGLGAVLFEILTGQAPHKGRNTTEVLHRVATQPTPRPRDAEPSVPPALDAICSRAMAHARNDRYATASELAEDVHRWLADEPVSAARDEWSQRLARWGRRNKTWARAGLIALVIVTVVSAMASLSIHLAKLRESDALASERIERGRAVQNARRAEESASRAETAESLAKQAAAEAEAKRRVAEESSAFLLSMFESSDPLGIGGLRFQSRGQQGQNISARDILDRGAKRIREVFQNQPAERAELMDKIGSIYRSLGLFEEATALLEEALATRLALFDETSIPVATSQNSVAWLRHDRGDYATAEELYRKSLATRRMLLGEKDQQTVEGMLQLAWLLADQNKHEESEQLFRRGVELRRKIYGSEQREVAIALFGLAAMLINRGDEADEAEAIKLSNEALQIFLAVEGDDSAIKLVPLFQRGLIMHGLGNLPAAEQALRELLAPAQRLLGDEHPYVAFITFQLGAVLRDRGDLDGAERHFREAIRIGRKTVGSVHPKIAIAIGALAGLRFTRRDFDDAEQLLREALQIRRNLPALKKTDVANSLSDLAIVLATQRKFDEAESALGEAIAIRRAELGPDHLLVATALDDLGDVLIAKGNAPAAEPFYRQAVEIDRSKRRPDDWETARKESVLGGCLCELGRFDDAETLLVVACEKLEDNKRAPIAQKRAAIERAIKLFEARENREKADAWRAKLESLNAPAEHSENRP